MKRYLLPVLFLFCLLSAAAFAQAIPPEESLGKHLEATIQDRLAVPVLKQTILGALAYLEDRQVRPRAGKHSCEYDSSDDGDGCKSVLSLNIPFRENIGLPAPPAIKARNRTGEWASHIHFLPMKLGFQGRAPAAVQDSNLFMTAFIGYPLYLFDEDALPPQKRHIERMLHLAMRNIQSFKRGDAYNFWAVLPGVRGKTPRTGPFNIQVQQLELLGKAYLNPKLDKVFAMLSRGLKTPPKYWIATCLDGKQNPTGADALFNIPNDADDTSTAVAFQYLYGKRFPSSGIRPDLAALQRITEFRDLHREREDGRDAWKGKNSGAYLTWILDEQAPVFGQPEMGVIPLAVNNVDAVVNANVAFSMALNGFRNAPGYNDCLNLLAQAVFKRAWPEAGLYYPQNMIFPYSVTRAWRDGGAREGPMKEAMVKLLRDLLHDQEAWARKHPTHKGAFSGGDDRSDHLATALGTTALLNIGRPLAAEAGLAREYDQAVRSGVRYLLQTCRWKKPKNATTKGRFSTPKNRVATWKSGLFFAASFWDLAHWRSEAFTVAMVLETLTKYALAFDLDQAPLGSRRLRLTN